LFFVNPTTQPQLKGRAMENLWQEYLRTLSKELGDELAREFVASLHKRSNGCVEAATEFFFQLGQLWSPLMQHWGSWAQSRGRGTMALILRDAKPLGALPMAKEWKKLYLNRLTCGIGDELSGESARQHPLLKKYLSQYDCAEYFTFVDSGCYGTVVLELHKLGVRFQPLFFFSKNPNIAGFLNEIGVSEKKGEILNDALECGFPHLCLRPTELVESNGKIRVVLHPSDPLSVRFGKAAMRGVRSAPASNASAISIAEALLSLSEKAHYEFTGILAHSSPEWSKKKEFLASWPRDLCWV